MTAPTETESAPAAALLNVPTPAAFGFLYDPPLGSVRYRVGFGGRGSGKSWQFGRALLIHGITRPLRILCAREYQSSVKDSVHRLLSDQIRSLGFQDFYKITQTSIVGANGTRFIFKGLKRDIASVKSTEGINICWLEEAESVSDRSWQTLTPTIREPGSEIWVTFNPALPTDSTYKRFVVTPPPTSVAIVRHVTYLDNPWLPDVLNEEQKQLAVADPDAHEHVWKGEPWQRSDSQVLIGKWRVADFDPDPETWIGPYFGADWGFAMDPTCLVKLWIYDRALHVEYDPGKAQLDNDDIARVFGEVPGSRDYVIRADNSRPETINEIKKRGFRVEGAPKWDGSVKDGIAHLRSYREIIIHPRCSYAIQEARLWRYKVDPRTGDILPHLLPGHDHRWDATRYGLAPFIKQKGNVGFIFPAGSK